MDLAYLDYVARFGEKIIEIARATVKDLGEKGREELKSEKDIVTKGDIAVAERIRDYLKGTGHKFLLLDEELGATALNCTPQDANFTVAIDDIDGTENYHSITRSKPYCSIFAIFAGRQPRFKDALVAGILEHSSGDIWFSVRSHGCHLTPGGDLRIGPAEVRASPHKTLDQRLQFRFDLYQAYGRVNTPRQNEAYARLMQQAWAKDFGSSAFHLAEVACGSAAGYVNPAHKAHELGAGYLLVTEAGGIITDFSGKDLGEQRFEFNRTYPIIATGTPELGTVVRKILNL